MTNGYEECICDMVCDACKDTLVTETACICCGDKYDPETTKGDYFSAAPLYYHYCSKICEVLDVLYRIEDVMTYRHKDKGVCRDCERTGWTYYGSTETNGYWLCYDHRTEPTNFTNCKPSTNGSEKIEQDSGGT